MTMKTTPTKPGLSALRVLGLCAAAGAILGPLAAVIQYIAFPAAPAVGAALSSERLPDGRTRYPIPSGCFSTGGEVAEEDSIPCGIEFLRAGCYYLTFAPPVPKYPPLPVLRPSAAPSFPDDYGCCLAPVLAQRLADRGIVVPPAALPQGECRSMKVFPSADAYERAYRQ